MAIMISSKPSDHPFFIKKIISRWRPKKSKSQDLPENQALQKTIYDTRPSLIPTPLPLVMPGHQQSLSTWGWTTVTFPQQARGSEDHGSLAPGLHPLQSAYERLFEASQQFFNEPDVEKQRWKHKLGSEEGWSKIAGEKEFITLRSLDYCPEILREPAKVYWDLMGAHLSNTLSRISTSLGLPTDQEDGLQRFVGPCRTMQDSNQLKTATMLRLFRYEGWDAKVVAEPHADLGLLSIVVGNVPGLEVWNGRAWFDVEREVERAGQKGASLLVGRQLEQLSNGRYPAGGHRVVAYGSSKHESTGATAKLPSSNPTDAKEKRYRFSIVFVLRAHEPVILNSDELETEITGKWKTPIVNNTVEKWYEEIRGRHFNINIDKGERERQRQKLRSKEAESEKQS